MPYRMCSLIECDIECVLLKNGFSCRMCSLEECDLLRLFGIFIQGCHVQRGEHIGAGRGSFQYNENFNGAGSVRNFEIFSLSLSLSLYIYICMYVYIKTCMFIYIYIYIYVYIYVYAFTALLPWENLESWQIYANKKLNWRMVLNWRILAAGGSRAHLLRCTRRRWEWRGTYWCVLMLCGIHHLCVCVYT